METFYNWAKSTLNAGISSSDTTLTLVSGGTAKMPPPPFSLVIWNSTDYSDPSDDPTSEIVRVWLPPSSETHTIARGRETDRGGRAAQNHNTGGKTYSVAQVLTGKGPLEPGHNGLVADGGGKSATFGVSTPSALITGASTAGASHDFLENTSSGAPNGYFTGMAYLLNGAPLGAYAVSNENGINAGLEFGGFLDFRLSVPSQATGTNDHSFRIGFGDGIDNNDASLGYITGGNWFLHGSRFGTTASTDTGVAVSTGDHWFRLIYDSANNKIYWYVDGVYQTSYTPTNAVFGALSLTLRLRVENSKSSTIKVFVRHIAWWLE